MAGTRLIAALGVLVCTSCANILPSGLAPRTPSSTGSAAVTSSAGGTVQPAVAPPVASAVGQSAPLERQALELKAARPPGPPAAVEGKHESRARDRAATLHDFQRSEINQRLPAKAPATLNANLSPAQCRTRLSQASTAAFKRQGPTSGIANPLRIAGEIGGVRFVAPGGKSPYGLLDCRLALTLIEFADFLRGRRIVEVRVDNFYRPNARLPSKRFKKSQHAYGLAIDVMALKHEDGRVFDIETDWGAGVTTEPCGAKATLPKPTENSVELRNLVCDLVNEALFHHHLTPSYNTAHRNHLHLDIKRDAKSLWVR